jgi:hypothetical protein
MMTKTALWSRKQKLEALKHVPHQYALEHVDFLWGEFIDMIHKGPRILLPAHTVLHGKNLHLSLLCIVPQ